MSSELVCFKAYDIRGKVGTELNDDIAYRIGRAYGQYLKPRSIILGGDVRLTSNSLKMALAKGLQESGADVIDIGMSGTEEVYFATSFLEADGGIEVTASHNPLDFNGMKLVRDNSKPISGDTGLREIQHLVESNSFTDTDDCYTGTYKKISIVTDYVNKLLSFIDFDNINRPLRLVVNSGNGSAGHVIDAIDAVFSQKNVPVEFIRIHHEADGSFPNGIPNPLLPECRQDTADAVTQNKADLGIAFDGDFDRCFLFDESGRFIEGYYIVGLLASAFLEKSPNAKIIHDPRLTWNTIELVKSSGGVPVLSKTGHAFIKERMRLEDAIYGGEMSAHHYFRDFYYCDSGMIPWLLVIELLCIKNKTLGQLVNDRMNVYPASGEINRKVDDADEAIKRVLEKYQEDAIDIDYTDGISIEFPEWRFNLRVSNTEPVIRLNVESRGDLALMEEKTNEILEMLSY